MKFTPGLAMPMCHTRLVAIAAAVLSAALPCTAAAQDHGLPVMPAHGQPLPIPGRSMVITRYGIVAASQPLAASAGVHMLEMGGNAVDAAIAANAANGLMEPAMNGVGGDLFAIVYMAKTGKIYGLNSSGWSASGMTPALLASKGLKRIPTRGIWGVTVPGAVAGWQALHDKFGTLPMSTLLAPAIRYAKEGFPVTEIIADTWAEYLRTLQATPDAAKTYLIDGHTPREGEIFRNPDLAQTLTRIAEHGRDGFYTGTTANAILATERQRGGTMTAADLTGFRPEWVTPLHVDYHGWTVYELPPNSQGIGALMMLQIMSHFPMDAYGFHATQSLHVMMEAKQLAYADVLQYVGDPRMAHIPVEQMLDSAHAAKRAAMIDPNRAICSEPPSQFSSITSKKGGDTIYLTVIDADGNIVSLIQSNYFEFGSGLVPAGSGFVLQDRGALFTLQPGMANTLAPHKRPLHTLIPAFMQKDSVRIGFGIMGGWNQAQAHAQFVANIADYGMSIQQALEAGRFTKPGFSGCNFDIESRIPQAVRDSLSAMGYDLTLYGPRTGHFGWGQAVLGTTGGIHYGASDPRHDGAAIPQQLPAQGSASPAADSASPVVGPARGTVVVVGGGAIGPAVNSAFIDAAGGPDALIIDVPNAGGADSYGQDASGARRLRAAGAHNVSVLFTTDRAVANSDSFVAVLKHAGGVWFDGGRQFHLVDAYAGTKTEQAFHDVLTRGGVVGGSSAGATILGEFLVRGAPSGNNRIMDYLGYEKGFAFLRGVGIDQHVVARERLADLADSIMPRYPHLLGMSEDEGTAWVVRGDTATIVGRNKAFVYGGHDANDSGKPFRTLHPGDRYNLATRHITHRAIEDSPVTMRFIDGLFAKYADAGAGGATVLVARNGEVFVDTSYGVPPQPKYMPTTTLPQFALGHMSGVFTALCAQLPAPAARRGTGTARGAASRDGRARVPMTAFQQCVTRQVGMPIGLHRTTADSAGQVSSDVDELYRLDLGLEDPKTWPGVDVTRGWLKKAFGGATWLAAYGREGGRRSAFVRIPEQRAVVIVLTNDDAADAKAMAHQIAARLTGALE